MRGMKMLLSRSFESFGRASDMDTDYDPGERAPTTSTLL
jgi:hypothetical protein